ncbi:DUF2000 family protein [Dyadobacter subterraneus]|uniref:DUF2000 domain-containing protein n=1 Tax=Dyadobacter subterraneus TaxID=2773304 RepID=A0ABR9WAD9_9BACT|nr:DUF2000 domain-containing protein [Dyadobacter subterraneus]MBE9462363.1 DUF2000 domain-containing protein [Dyadobacter subterraneus]
MRYENKIVMVVRNDLETWQKLNVASFLASSVAIGFPETHGQPLINASGSQYLPLMKHPVLVYKADSPQQIIRAFNRAKDRELAIGIYTQPLFSTRNEEQNLSEIAKETDESQELAGIIIYGENRKVDKAIDGLKLHD